MPPPIDDARRKNGRGVARRCAFSFYLLAFSCRVDFDHDGTTVAITTNGASHRTGCRARFLTLPMQPHHAALLLRLLVDIYVPPRRSPPSLLRRRAGRTGNNNVSRTHVRSFCSTSLLDLFRVPSMGTARPSPFGL